MTLSGITEINEEILFGLNVIDILSTEAVNHELNLLTSKDNFWHRKLLRDYSREVFEMKPEAWTYREFCIDLDCKLHAIEKGVQRLVLAHKHDTFVDYAFVALVAPPCDDDEPFDFESYPNAIWLLYNPEKDIFTTQEVIDDGVDDEVECEQPIALCALTRFSKLFGYESLKRIDITLY